jgi:hypothetical protein
VGNKQIKIARYNFEPPALNIRKNNHGDIIISTFSFTNKSILNFGKMNSRALSKGCHLDVVRGPSTPHVPESDAGGSLSSWQAHPSR